jgi:hypothetical protein
MHAQRLVSSRLSRAHAIESNREVWVRDGAFRPEARVLGPEAVGDLWDESVPDS